MTSTLAVGRVSTLEKLRLIEPFLASQRKTTAAGNAGGTTFECDHLGYRPDDMFNDVAWAILPQGPTGSSTLEVQRAKDFDQDDGSGNSIVTVYDAFSAQVQNAVDMYISPVHPESLRLALNNATSKIYPWAFIPRKYHHISNSRVFNGFWDFWKTSALPEWWKVSHADLVPSQHTEQAYHGEYSLKLVEGGGNARYLASDPVSPSYLQRDAGEKITLHALMYVESASSLGVSIQNGSGIGTIVYHSGTPGWEEVETAETTLVEGRPGTPIEFHINVAANKTGYVGPVWTEGGQEIEVIHIPPQFRRTPNVVSITGSSWPTRREDFHRLSGFETANRYPAVHPTNGAVMGNTLRFGPRDLTTTPSLMRLEGEDYIEEATVETDVYAVEAPLDELLWIEAIIELKNGLAQQLGSGGAALERQLAIDWMQERERLLDQPAFQMTPTPKVVQPMFGPPAFGGGGFGPDDR
jgi:hypothetical protein|tara:strand:+ start:1325 stop:2725 length:1401 start_codon:yes stop_codon:yes gene_type:complete